MKKRILAVFCALVAASTVCAQTTAFTYQGRLIDGGQPAKGSYDLAFTVYDDGATGNLVAF